MKSFAYYDLIERFAEPGCAVCKLLQRDVARLLDSMMYEYVNDPGVQKRFRRSRALCGEHGWQLAQHDNALGIAILYEQSLHEILDILGQVAPSGKRTMGRRLFPASDGAALAGALEPEQTCIACETLTTNETSIIRALVDDIADPKMQAAYRASHGLCIGHFKQALRRSTAERATIFAEIQRVIWSRLRAELNEYMRKTDYQHAGEAFGEEADSWLRAVARLSGERGIFGVKRG